jgi:hypothetical protein
MVTRKSILLFAGGFFTALALVGIGVGAMMYYTNRVVAELEQPFPFDNTKEILRSGAELQKAKTAYERWIALGDAGMWAVEAGALDSAKTYAEELLQDSGKYPEDWNYGNAIHKGNLILGRVALRQGNRAEAARHLLTAGRTPGSPQLNSFGPNMTLAKELLEVGERDIVLQYVDLCRTFWLMDLGNTGAWEKIIDSGRIPNFGPHLVY